jgi:hypothetical protein
MHFETILTYRFHLNLPKRDVVLSILQEGGIVRLVALISLQTMNLKNKFLQDRLKNQLLRNKPIKRTLGKISKKNNSFINNQKKKTN